MATESYFMQPEHLRGGYYTESGVHILIYIIVAKEFFCIFAVEFTIFL